jgi:hypothetical protein
MNSKLKVKKLLIIFLNVETKFGSGIEQSYIDSYIKHK